MSENANKKCVHFNSGYCRYTKKQNGCKDFHPTEICETRDCKVKGCPKRHPKRCRYSEECRFQSQCSYFHQKRAVVINEKSDLLEKIKDLKEEIFTLKKDNDDKINMLAKVHLKELLDMKEKNDELQKRIIDFKVKLAARDKELSEEVNNDVEAPETFNEKTSEPIMKDNFKCKLCDFKAKSSRGLKTHIGHMHKYNEQNTELVTENENENTSMTEVSTLSSFQFFTCKLCGKEFQMQEDSTRHAYAHVIIQSVDMTPLPE